MSLFCSSSIDDALRMAYWKDPDFYPEEARVLLHPRARLRQVGEDADASTEVFWSFTLYDLNNGVFIPNDRKKYSVGENAGMKLDEKGGIEVYVAAEKPEGVPEENWLPINRKDEDMDMVLRIYVSDLEKMKTWQVPKAEKISK